MEDITTIEIKLRGSEAMFVTPVSHSYYKKNRKFYKYNTLEFSPRIPFPLKHYIYESTSHNIKFWWFRFTKLINAIKVIAEVFLDNFPRFTGVEVFNPWFKNKTWEWWNSYLVEHELSHEWFYAVEVFQPNEPLHIRGNIEVGSSKYIDWDFGYATPSSLWIEERLKEEFHVWTFDKEEDRIAEEKFWKWRQEQIDKGYEIFYITSLET